MTYKITKKVIKGGQDTVFALTAEDYVSNGHWGIRKDLAKGIEALGSFNARTIPEEMSTFKSLFQISMGSDLQVWTPLPWLKDEPEYGRLVRLCSNAKNQIKAIQELYFQFLGAPGRLYGGPGERAAFSDSSLENVATFVVMPVDNKEGWGFPINEQKVPITQPLKASGRLFYLHEDDE